MDAFCESLSPYRTVKYLPHSQGYLKIGTFDLRKDATACWQPVALAAVTLERRHKQTAKDAEEHHSDANSEDEVRAASEEARRDASRRASELIAKLRKL
jgi:hypothetical protein